MNQKVKKFNIDIILKLCYSLKNIETISAVVSEKCTKMQFVKSKLLWKFTKYSCRFSKDTDIV